MCLAIPGKIVSVTGGDLLLRSGRVDFGGVVREASLACVPEANVGDYVIVHAGMALSKLEPGEAARVLADLRAIDALGQTPQAERE